MVVFSQSKPFRGPCFGTFLPTQTVPSNMFQHHFTGVLNVVSAPLNIFEPQQKFSFEYSKEKALTNLLIFDFVYRP
jgi:hypothetical protein